MFSIRDRYNSGLLCFIPLIALIFLSTLSLIAVPYQPSDRATFTPDASVDPTPLDKPFFSSYKGVTLGITADAARKLLGKAQDQSDDQDLYVFSEKETAQVYYDAAHLVMAISVTFTGDLKSAPTAKIILGEDISPKPDGGIFKLVRYPKAGCYVSYSKTSGDNPSVSVTIQKI